MTNADCLVVEKTTIGNFLKFYRVRVGILNRIFKREREETTPQHIGLRTDMKNIYIFRDGNGIGCIVLTSPDPIRNRHYNF